MHTCTRTQHARHTFPSCYDLLPTHSGGSAEAKPRGEDKDKGGPATSKPAPTVKEVKEATAAAALGKAKQVGSG